MPKPRKSRISKIYQKILDRLPSTYPHAELIIHLTITELRESYKNCNGDDEGEPPYAFCDSADNTIHVSQAFYNENVQSMAFYFLHEIGHLYSLQKFGGDDIRWSDYKASEQYANTFAYRWIRKLKQENWFKSLKF